VQNGQWRGKGSMANVRRRLCFFPMYSQNAEDAQTDEMLGCFGRRGCICLRREEIVNDNAEGLLMRVFPTLVSALVDVETDSDDSEDEKNAAASGGGRRCKNQEA
jgi:hypothetical protein